MKAFDIVSVPDFSGPAAARFEARTLLFLASWIEYGGTSRSFPLHLACIGEPPASVEWLAARCGARISIHQGLEAEGRGAGNKLRGLEVRGQEERVLLLDTDVLILSDISHLTNLGQGIAVAPALLPRIPDRCWSRIYPALGMEIPRQRMSSSAGGVGFGLRKDIASQGPPFDVRSMLPYYNSGVILAPWACELRTVWEDHIRRIAALFKPGDEGWTSVGLSDQAGLATAVQFLKTRGMPVLPLPDRAHAHWLFLYRNTPRLEDYDLFHALFIFGKTTAVSARLELQLYRYRLHLMHQMLGAWQRDETRASRAASLFTYLLPAIVRANRLGVRLNGLYQKHVAPAIRHAYGRMAAD